MAKDKTLLRLTISKDIIARHKRPEGGFMHYLITDDETWTYSAEQKSKLVSEQLVQDGSQTQKN